MIQQGGCSSLSLALRQGCSGPVLVVVVSSAVQMCYASSAGLQLLNILTFLASFLYLLEDDNIYMRAN